MPVPDPSSDGHEHTDAGCGDGGFVAEAPDEGPDAGDFQSPSTECGDVVCAEGTFCLRQYPGVADAGFNGPSPKALCITLPAGCTQCASCPNAGEDWCGTPCSDIVDQPGQQFYDCMGI
jgi:hypothetical protein